LNPARIIVLDSFFLSFCLFVSLSFLFSIPSQGLIFLLHPLCLERNLPSTESFFWEEEEEDEEEEEENGVSSVGLIAVRFALLSPPPGLDSGTHNLATRFPYYLNLNLFSLRFLDLVFLGLFPFSSSFFQGNNPTVIHLRRLSTTLCLEFPLG